MALILVIEPDKILADNISKFLERRGHTTNWHTSAQGGIDSTDQKRPDAIVMDLQLAGHSGVEFLHELRSYADWQNLPVVIFSSVNPQVLGGEEATKASLTISAYVHKPTASLSKLAKTIEQSIKSSIRAT